MRVRNFIKKNYKIGIGVMIGLIISIVGVYASDTTSDNCQIVCVDTNK